MCVFVSVWIVFKTSVCRFNSLVRPLTVGVVVFSLSADSLIALLVLRTHTPHTYISM